MVTITMKVGQKGQIVIPKVFRDEYGMSMETEVILTDTGDGILLQKPVLNIAEEFARLAQQAHKRIKVDPHLIEEEYEERLRRSGFL